MNQHPIAEAPVRDEEECAVIGFMMPDLAVDKYGYSITILENGYVTVSGFGSATFFIGEDAAQEFLRGFAEHSVMASAPELILEEGGMLPEVAILATAAPHLPNCRCVNTRERNDSVG